MWAVDGTPTAADWLDFEPVKVLYDFDGPKIFTCKARSRDLFLAFQCDEEGEVTRFLVVPFSEDLERRLTEGKMNVRDALTRLPSWVFDLGGDWKPLRCWK